jgi:hypothetical protein
MAEGARTRLLDKEVVYEGEEYNRDSLQTMVKEYQDKHTVELKDLEKLRQAHDDIATEMNKDLVESKTAWDCLKGMMTLNGHKIGNNFRDLLEKIPVVNDYIGERPIADLLREKIEVAEMRTKQVGQFLDKIEVQIEQINADITRLNKKMVLSAQNGEKAAAYILELQSEQQRLNAEAADVPADQSKRKRELQAQADEVKRKIWEHGGKLRLYKNAEERISGIVAVDNNFLEILTNLHSNMTTLFDSGQEILDELRGNATGLATAAQASELTIDMQKSLESLKTSVNKVATLASQTSLYLTQNLERMTSQMKIYDDATKSLIESNLAAEREIQDKRVDETLALAKQEMTLVHEAKTGGTGPLN